MTIKTAMILAAGLGTRMRPITNTLPKPLVEVAGKPLIAYGLEALERLGVSSIVVNVHYLAPLLIDWLRARPGPKIIISDETAELLDSGGGIVKALPDLGTEPFLVLNADTFWLEDPQADIDNLASMTHRFDAESMDILVMTARLDQATGHTGAGDFTSDEQGRLTRFEGHGQPLIYAGALILNPAVFDAISVPRFSINQCFDRAASAGRLFGAPMQGHWLTVGTPEAIGEAEAARTAFLAARSADAGEPVQ
ncbi:nucleotidyltransferase family protein [Hoeflea sp. YIM 152468]|uniref:nucleotidyltransferase family protein n=1 Tax=Hoeflea sp. YIM 152468 TaxID=3031759 RepID=UPI0023D99CFC|nr:nucleotidyltransferase family protein [Hoeflea sp. YIM 152468]MDF1610462.1 nucleotidyltransferase family protein [Hoeflea sp. YIM 152468]